MRGVGTGQMMGHTHFTFGALFAATAVHLGHAEPTVAFFMGAQLGSLAPDLDHPSALLSKKIPMSAYTIGLLKHRTLTHSIFGMAIVYALGKYLFPVLWSWIYPWLLDQAAGYAVQIESARQYLAGLLGDGFLWGFMIGYASHIIIDLFNPMGVQLFYPFDFLPNKGWVHPPFGWGIKTGSIWELVFTVVSLVAATFIEPKVGMMTAAIAIAFWYVIGKPGLPRYRL